MCQFYSKMSIVKPVSAVRLCLVTMKTWEGGIICTSRSKWTFRKINVSTNRRKENNGALVVRNISSALSTKEFILWKHRYFIISKCITQRYHHHPWKFSNFIMRIRTTVLPRNPEWSRINFPIKEVNVGDDSWWNIPCNLWFLVIKKQVNSNWIYFGATPLQYCYALLIFYFVECY